jgi:hypothetical protein
MTAGLEAVYAGVWVAAGELPTGKRRVARVALMAATAAVGAVKERSDPADQSEQAAEDKASPAEKARDRAQSMTDEDKRRLAKKVILAATTGPVLAVGRRQLRKRWLTRLSGHPHPQRALAVRMAALTFVISLARHALTAAKSQRKTSQS